MTPLHPFRMIHHRSTFHAGDLKQVVDEPLEVQVFVVGNPDILRPLLLIGCDGIIPQQLQIVVKHRQRGL